METFSEEFEGALLKSDLNSINRLLKERDQFSQEDLQKMIRLAQESEQEKSHLKRTTGEKIMLYLGGTISALYTLNLIAYTFSGYLQEQMFKAHNLTPQHIYPLALLVISLFGLIAARGWYGPYARLKRATEIKEALSVAASA